MIPRLLARTLMMLTLLGAVAGAGAAEMRGWLDRNVIEEGESARLTLEVQGQVDGRPDTAPLEADFEVLGISSGSRVSIVNGRTDTRTTWTLTLSPKRSGTLTIPPLRVGTLQSDPLTLEVSEAPAPAPGGGADIFIETELAPRDPYVQGEATYTIRLFYAVALKGGQLGEPEPEDVLVQRLGEDRSYTATRGGRRYQVIERRYALYPQRSGAIELAAPVFDGDVPDASRRRSSPFSRFFGNDPFFGTEPFGDLLTPTRRVRVRGEPERLEVRPRPDAAQGPDWLPAEGLNLAGRWQPDEAEVRAGEPVTLEIELEAKGLTGGQLPSPAPETVPGFKVYPDRAERRTDAGEKGVIGHLRQKIAFIPERPGRLDLPAIEVRWWDTKDEQERVATLPGRVLEVMPARGGPAPAGTGRPASPPASDERPEVASRDTAGQPAPARVQTAGTDSSGPWPWVSAALGLGWMLTLSSWWWQRHRSRTVREREPLDALHSTDGTAARKEFLAACATNDATAARQALLAWAAARWPTDPPTGLDGVARRLDDPRVGPLLTSLDRTLYKGGGSWDARQTAEVMRPLLGRRDATKTAEGILPPLYPTAPLR